MFQLGYAELGDITGIIISESAPAAEDRDKAWIKLVAGAPAYPYPAVWFNGHWVIRHPLPGESSLRQIWVGSSVDLETFDGGQAGAVGVASGPMWEIDTAFAGRVPIGAGTIPGTDPARSIQVEQTTDSAGGEGSWVRELSRANLPDERLHLFADQTVGEPLTDLGIDDVAARYANVDSESQSYRIAKASGFTNPNAGVTDSLGQGESFVQAPPVYGVYFIKRTARQLIIVA